MKLNNGIYKPTGLPASLGNRFSNSSGSRQVASRMRSDCATVHSNWGPLRVECWSNIQDPLYVGHAVFRFADEKKGNST